MKSGIQNLFPLIVYILKGFTMAIDYDYRRNKFLETLDIFVNDPNMIMMNVLGDDKYYLKKTKYRIEIRSDESTTWLTYVMRPAAGDESYKDSLADAYIDLVKTSNPEHFEEAANE